MRRHKTIAAASVTLAILTPLLTTAACGSAPQTSSGGGSSQQILYVDTIIKDRNSLVPGVLTYSAIDSLPTGQRTFFTVSITASQAARLIEQSRAPSPEESNGVYTYPSNVSVGGAVNVTATCNGMTCVAEQPPSTQNILVNGDNGTWTWQVTAGAPGSASIVIVATTYDQNSTTVLAQTKPIEEDINITATSGYVYSRIASWLQWLIGAVGLSAIGTAITWIWRRIRRRRNAPPPNAKPKPKKKQPPRKKVHNT